MALHDVHLLRTHPARADTRAYLAWSSRMASERAGWTQRPGTRVAGNHRPWLVTDDGVALDGLFAVAPHGLERRAELPAPLPEQPLLTVEAERDEVLRHLSLRTAAELALDELRDLALARPRATEAEIRACDAWMTHWLRQYLTGRGALRSTVVPWQRFLGDYEEALGRVEKAWEGAVLPGVAAARGIRELAPILEPLALVGFARDATSILAEYRTRLHSLAQECTRVSAEVGVVGTLGSLALVPLTDTLGPLFLIPVGVATVAYYGGYAIARGLRRDRPRRPARPPRAARPASVAAAVERLATERVRVVTGPALGSVDAACALRLQLALLERCGPGRVTISAADAAGGGVRLVLGGPLVRAPVAGDAAPACDLTDVHGDGWEVRAEGRTLAIAADDEALGCLSRSRDDPDALFLFGTRDTGTLRAARWLERALAGEAGADGEWVLLPRERL